ncbi:E3 ubiquitin-protein ligase NEDD4 [Fistulifera solaris]|uniref:HECT-type E3 ubiquitin transferase n=1 Tax=Fistulifera solaris TaxID=1519565 RepID=A0A1Z5K6N4_FISSO|nr:E3 ubiquitin-protein ligase NEDD4 [Fistulifera solaris]|eukprot:GAX21855.1 E3 ubiquitin-protein ligase NEDD4 [Fistulifera solaris]
MPSLFRIMGGGGNSSSSNNNNRQLPQPQQSLRSSASRLTYPGNRAAAAPSSDAAPSMPTTFPRTGGLSDSNTASAASSAGPVTLQGSAVDPAAARVPPPPATEAATRPGAYQVTRTAVGPAQVYRVTVPVGVRPGAEFTVHAGLRRVRVRCPPTSSPGQSLQITLPPEPVTHHLLLKMAPLTAAEGTPEGGGAVTMTPDVQAVNRQAMLSGGTAQTFLVTIPPNVHPGQQFTVNVGGQRFAVTCPPSAGPNQKVRIVPPVVRDEPEAAPTTQVFEVAVPEGVQPGQPFALMANDQRVLVTCPPNVVPGQKIRFQLPVSHLVGKIELAYESETSGWRRTVRVNDLKFQWVRLEKKKEDAKKEKTDDNDEDPLAETTEGMGPSKVVDVEGMKQFDFRRSAYVRKVYYLEGNDARMRTGTIELIPAHEAVVDSRLVYHNRTLLSYSDIASVQGKSLQEKTEWFQNICNQLTAAWEDGHIKIAVRRSMLLQDSVDAVMSLGRDDLRKRWRIEFLGEPGIDAGGVAREWFELVTEQIFDPAFGLWIPSANNQACVNINPSSGLSCPEDHLIYFRFLGRVIGRALFDRQLIKGHMVQSIYKHILGWPITFEDIKAQDEEYYHSLQKLTKMEDVSIMYLDFTVTEESMGARREIELTEGGALTEVTNANLEQYLESNLRYRMLERTRPQLQELLLGFFDVIPEPPLTIFDANELELTLCGLPTIDMEDWQANTKYSGLYEMTGRSHETVQWFWEVVLEEFDQEQRARLLQFVTGTSGVPSRGFSVLQGIDGNIKKFTIHGVDRKAYFYPRAHTCFNRIDLPNYSSKEELLEKLKAAISLSGVGFDIE